MPAGCTASGSAADAAAPPPAAAAAAQEGAPSPTPASTNSSFSIPYYDTLPLGLPNPTVLDHGTTTTAAAAALTGAGSGRSRYLCYFVHRHLEFRLPEVESLAQAVPAAAAARGGDGPPVVWEKPVGNRLESPFWYVHLRGGDAAAAAVGGSCMLAKVLLEVWGEGETFEGLQAAVAGYSPETKARWGAPDQSFKFVVDTWGCSLTTREQVGLIEALEVPTQFKGPIDLVAPQNRFWLIVAKSNGFGLPALPHRYYFGREVVAGDRTVMNTYDLRRRRYLGPTSMDTEMAFLMTNLAGLPAAAGGGATGHPRPALVLDPFVGTGSCLIPAAHRGALVLGCDIDARVIKMGKLDKAGQAVNIWTNFADYGLPPPLGLLRCDLHTAPFRPALRGMLDAIVCDPPYGVRAGGRKSEGNPDRVVRDVATHRPATVPYSLAECLHDLLECAAKLLRTGGRLVYFMPAAPGFYTADEVPQHPALELVANCEQILTTRYSRRLITMRKARPYCAEAAAAYYERRGPPRTAIDGIHDYVYASPAALAAEAGMSEAEQRAAAVARIPRNRGKCI